MSVLASPRKCNSALTRVILALLLMAVLRPVSAGLVEDAEEELLKIRQQQKTQSRNFSQSKSSVSMTTGQDSAQTIESRPSESIEENLSKKKAQPKTPTFSSSAKTEREKALVERDKRLGERRKSDRIFSLFGVLLLLGLIAAGVVFSRTGKEDD